MKKASSNTFTSANGVYARGRTPPPPPQAPPPVTLPRLLREAAPYLRLIVMLRDPGDRLYSAYHYYRWWDAGLPPPTPADFHNRTAAGVAAWRACEAKFGARACARRYEPEQLVKGMYAEFLPDWLAHWPRAQLLFLRFEDYARAREAHVRAALAHLGITGAAADADGALLRALAAPVSNQGGAGSGSSGGGGSGGGSGKGGGASRRAPMLPETRRLLDDFYAPFNARLAAALGGDARWLWRPEDRAGAAPAPAAGRRRRRRQRRRRRR